MKPIKYWKQHENWKQQYAARMGGVYCGDYLEYGEENA
jgi:hypothetical protein